MFGGLFVSRRAEKTSTNIFPAMRRVTVRGASLREEARANQAKQVQGVGKPPG